MQADVDQNESDADAAIAAVQADVNINETDSDNADATLQSAIDTKQDIITGGASTITLIIYQQILLFCLIQMVK